MFSSYNNSGNLNTFQSQSEKSLQKAFNPPSLKPPFDVRNQENLDPNEQNQDIQQSNSKETPFNNEVVAHNFIQNDQDIKAMQDEEEKEPMLRQKQHFQTMDDIFQSLRVEDPLDPQIFYQEGDQGEGAKLLRASFFSEFEKGIIELEEGKDPAANQKKEKMFPRLDAKNYKLVEILGKGYHGLACKLREKNNNEIVVKLYLKDRKDDFFQEACVLSEHREHFGRGVNKQNLLFVNESQDRIPPYFEMENYYGLTLRAGLATLRGLKNYLKETNKKLTESQLLYLAYQIFAEYSKLQNLKYVHRDIKPENIIFLPSLEVRIIDFGFAKKYGELSETIKDRAGTKVFMSPALLQKTAKDPITFEEVAAGDLYALGLSLLEIAAPSINLQHPNRAKAINDALNKVTGHQKLLKLIDEIMNCKDVRNNFRGQLELLREELGETIYPGTIFEEFKRYLQEKTLQCKSAQEVQKFREDEEEISMFFQEPQDQLQKDKKRSYQGFEREAIGDIGLCSYFQIKSFELNRDIVHALVDKLLMEGFSCCCKGLKKAWEAPFVKGIEGLLDKFHEKEIEQFSKEDFKERFRFWGHLNNLMVLKEYLGLEIEGKTELEDQIMSI